MIDYRHWQRFDGSFDSICPVCVVVIAYAHDEAELAEKEKGHICEPAKYATFKLRRGIRAIENPLASGSS
jgi:hypothetical protein